MIKVYLAVILILLCANRACSQPAGKAAQWKGIRVSSGAPLPPAERFKPRSHGEEAVNATLSLDVLAKLDIEMQRHVAAKNVAGISAIIHKTGQRGYFEMFGMADIEKNRPVREDAIFRLMSMTKPVIALAALTLYDESIFGLDDPISKHYPEWEPSRLSLRESTSYRGAIVDTPITPRILMSHSSGLGYGWGGADGTQFVIDRKNNSFTLFMVQTQHYKAPTYPAFLAIANEAAGIKSPASLGAAGSAQSGGTANPFNQRDKNNDGKLDRDELPAALFDKLDQDRDGF